MRKFYNFVFEPVAFKVEVDMPLSDAVDSLHANVFAKVPGFNSPEGMLGIVSEDTVKISRMEKIMRSNFKSFFLGSFTVDGDKTTLSGHFQIERFSRFVLSIAMVLVPLVSVPYLFSALTESAPNWSKVVAILLFNAGVYLCLAYVGYSCKQNRLFLEAAIENALGSEHGTG